MKITKAALRKIIQEEFEAVRSEGGDHEQQDLQNAVHDLSELVVNQIYARTGVTTDLERRLHEHNNTRRAAKYTKSRRPVKLIYSASYSNRSEAQKAEYKFKRLNKSQKKKVIYNESR